MNWYQYTANVRVLGEAAKAVEERHACCLCNSRLERLAWRALAYPYHWQPFGWICSSCNAVYVMSSDRLADKPTGSRRARRRQSTVNPPPIDGRQAGPVQVAG